ncbi:MAG: fructose-bisphosphatase class II, partial [Actinomycetes bacterium]
LFNGERIGDGSPMLTDIAVDRVDGTTLTALGRGGAIAVIAVSERGTMFDPGPCVYMEKIAVGPECVGVIDITRSATENLHAVAEAKASVLRAEKDVEADLIAEWNAFARCLDGDGTRDAMLKFLADGGQTRDGELRLGALFD